jgi:putative peptide zinc metalloprotease protein
VPSPLRHLGRSAAGLHRPSLAAAEVFVPDDGARVTAVLTHDGAAVAMGATLVALASPDLAYQLGQAKSDLALLEWQLSAQGVSPDLLAKSRAAEHEYEQALASYQSLADETAKLQVKAPIAGRVVDLGETLRPGEWEAARERLLAVIEPGRAAIEAFVAESDLARIEPGTKASFYPEGGWGAPLAARVTRIERANTAGLAEPYLASRCGGDIPVREQGHGEFAPEISVYRVTLAPAGPTAAPNRVLRGRVVLSRTAQNLALRAWRRILAVAVHETGL